MFCNDALKSPIRPWQWTAAALMIFGLAACSGSGGGSAGAVSLGPTATTCVPNDTTTAAECGILLVGLTDAEGDIVNYEVDVVSLALERADGTIVETVPATTRIDFAQLTDLSELLSSTMIVPGEFVGGTLTIDYSNASATVEIGGELVSVDIVGPDGNPLGQTDVRIDLAAGDHLFLRRGKVAFLGIDFDLAASHELDTSTVPPRLIAQPFVVADVQAATDRELRVRGPLVGVDLANDSYEIRVRPWQRADGDHGSLNVHTTSTTSYEIGDAMYVGADGLQALAELEPGTLTVAFGALDLTDRTFTASRVYARDSVGGQIIDTVQGNIVARDGNRLTVKGALGLHRHDRARFYRTAFVEVGPQTLVFETSNDAAVLSATDLSVGQRIVAFGDFLDDPNAVADPAVVDIAPVLDATNGRVRMEPTRLHGTVTGSTTGQLNLNLRAIDRLGVEFFDFSGTGLDSSVDADPADYEVATGPLALDALGVGRPVEVVGFVSPFGAAPSDFTASTIVGYHDIGSALGISWTDPGTTAPFTSMGSDGLVLDLSNPDIGERHHLLLGRELVDLLTLPASPTIVPGGERMLFSISEPGHVELFMDFAAFLDELTLRLNNAYAVRSLAAYGSYDEIGNTVEAHRIDVYTLSPE